MLKKTLYIFLIKVSFVFAQINGKSIAILDFNSNGMNKMESIVITNIFNDELSKTSAVSVVNRKIVKENLLEQGIEQIKCKNLGCISKAGATLSVQFIIDGLVQKNKKSFSLEINIYKVSDAMKPLIVTSLVNGEVVVRKKMKEPKLTAIKTKKINYKGSTDGFINEIKVMAWELVGLIRPEEKFQQNEQIANVETIVNIDRYGTVMRSMLVPGLGQMYVGERTWGWLWLGAETIVCALAISEYKSYKTALNSYNEYQNEYLLSNDPLTINILRTKAQESRKSMITADQQITSFLYALGGIWMANTLHALVINPKNPTLVKNKTTFNFAYNDILKQPELRFSINLD